MLYRENRDHACHRAKERYGVPLSHDQYERLVDQIERGEAPYIERGSNDTDIFAVRHRHLTLWAAYSRNTDHIITFLPPDRFA